jgi:hypothetical protein
MGLLSLGLIRVRLYYDFVCTVRGLGLFTREGTLSLGLTMVHLYYDFALRSGRFRLFKRVC